MPVPIEIIQLVARFDEQLASYQASSYNEAQLRQEFVNPLFKALGWDVDNEQSYAEAYKEVIHEDSIWVEESRKAPDYSFRIGGQRKFFVESKKPSIPIRQDASSAFQLRRYAWSAKLPLSILTNFEGFAVYDCRVRPDHKDKASKARTLYLDYHQYEERWDEIASVFSRDAILKGSFDRYALSTSRKRGTAEVDAAFLQEIEQWRYDLARNLALRNEWLDQRSINFAVQRVIDRIVFLRICEDRGIESYGRLKKFLDGEDIYPRMRRLFQEADERYNSGLFHFRQEVARSGDPDEWTLSLKIDDRILKGIIRRLYYPESPYAFSVLSADILGQVYEQFLGKVIRLTKGHQAKIEDKPEVKKAGGVFYTPQYVSAYIVQQTIGKQLEGKTPYQVAARTKAWKRAKRGQPLAVLDPACGSGSFLIVAYQYLLDWYCDWYVKDGLAKHKDRIYQTRANEWKLTSAERKRILIDHIYGVDIDLQAVEVTKLSLLLKVLEGETSETLQRQLFVKQRALPDLGGNIKCGNSLISPDFYHGRQLNLFDEDEQLRINAFDWNLEFSEVMQSGGFHAIIGNPPYGAAFSPLQGSYYREKFKCATQNTDSFALFIEKSLRQLQTGGTLGMIVQSSWVSSPKMATLREVFASGFRPLAFVTMPYDVFSAYIDTVIVIAEKSPAGQSLSNLKTSRVDLVVFPPRFKVTEVEDFDLYRKRADAARWVRGKHDGFLVTSSDAELRIVKRVESIGGVLADVCDIQRGVTPFRIVKKAPEKNPMRAFSGTVRRYRIFGDEGGFIQYDDSLAEYKPPRYFRGKRLLLRELVSRQFQLQAVLTSDDFITNKSMQSILLTDENYAIEYILAILNSKLIAWYFLATQSVGRRDDFPKIVLRQTRGLPLRTLAKADWQSHDRLVMLVKEMMTLNKKLDVAKVPHERTVLRRRIEATDREIDQLVYELYGLTEKDVRLVEEATCSLKKE